MSKTKIISIIIAILTVTILVSGIIVAYKAEQSTFVSNETMADRLAERSNNEDVNLEIEQITSDIDASDWKTYRNDEYGFEFKYPIDWNIREYKRGEPKNDPTISKRTLEFLDSSDNFKLFVIVDDAKNLHVYAKPDKNVLVNTEIVGILEKGSRIQVIFPNSNNIISFNGVKPISSDLYNAIILSYKNIN